MEQCKYEGNVYWVDSQGLVWCLYSDGTASLISYSYGKANTMNKIKELWNKAKDSVVSFAKQYRNWILWAIAWSLYGAFILNPIWTYLSGA